MDRVAQDIPEDVAITDKEDEAIMDVAMAEEDLEEEDHSEGVAHSAEVECRHKDTEEDPRVANQADTEIVIHPVAMGRTT